MKHLLILKEVMHNLEADLRQRDEGKEYERPLGSSKAVEFVPSGGVTGTFFLVVVVFRDWWDSDETFQHRYQICSLLG